MYSVLYSFVFLSRVFTALALLCLLYTAGLAQDAAPSRGMTPEEYALATGFAVEDLDNDTYVKVADGRYVLDRYDMKPPYFITGDSGVKKRIDLYKITERESMQDIGLLAFFTDTESGKTFNLVIPHLQSEPEVWNQYFDDIHQHDREEKDVALKMSYVLSKEVAYLMQKADGVDMSALEDANAGYDFCFPGQALVAMSDGRQKAMADVQVGDLVLAYHDGEKRFARVETISRHQQKSISLARVTLEVEEVVTASAGERHQPEEHTLVATPNHPVLTDRGKKRLEQLRAGDVLYRYQPASQSFERYAVRSVDLRYDTAKTVYHLLTSEDSYLVEGVVVLEK